MQDTRPSLLKEVLTGFLVGAGQTLGVVAVLAAIFYVFPGVLEPVEHLLGRVFD